MNPEESLFFDIGIASLISSSFQFSTAITEAQPTAGDRGNAPSRRYLARNVTSTKYHPALSAKRSISPPAWQAGPPLSCQPLCNLSSPLPIRPRSVMENPRVRGPEIAGPRMASIFSGTLRRRAPRGPTRLPWNVEPVTRAPLLVSVSGVQATRAAPAGRRITINGYRDRDACHPATRSGQFLFFFRGYSWYRTNPPISVCPSYLT